jgi:hypothetical protein
VGFVAIVRGHAIGAAKPTLASVHFVALAPPTTIVAAKRTYSQHFVALARPAPMIATFVPYSQHFVALPTPRR